MGCNVAGSPSGWNDCLGKGGSEIRKGERGAPERPQNKKHQLQQRRQWVVKNNLGKAAASNTCTDIKYFMPAVGRQNKKTLSCAEDLIEARRRHEKVRKAKRKIDLAK